MTFCASWGGRWGRGWGTRRRHRIRRLGDEPRESRVDARSRVALTGAGTTWLEASYRGWYPPSRTTWKPGFPGTRALPPSETRIWSQGLRICRSQCSEGPRPSAPTPGPPRGPHPSRSFKGNSPKPSRNADAGPQFRRREQRVTGKEAGPGPRTLPAL